MKKTVGVGWAYERKDQQPTVFINSCLKSYFTVTTSARSFLTYGMSVYATGGQGEGSTAAAYSLWPSWEEESSQT